MLSDVEHRVMRRVGLALRNWSLIQEGDRVMVCVSGGASSFCMALALDQLKRRLAINFSLYPVLFDRGENPEKVAGLIQRLRYGGVELECVSVRGLSIETEDWMHCRALRKMMFDMARDRDLDRIALGHNLDYLIETLMVNLLFNGRLAACAVISEEIRGPALIRPMAYLERDLIQQLAMEKGLDSVDTVVTQTRRTQMREVFAQLATTNPRIRRSILASMKHIRERHLLTRLEHTVPT